MSKHVIILHDLMYRRMSVNSLFLVVLDAFGTYVDDDHIPGYQFTKGDELGDFTLYYIFTPLPNSADGDGLSLDINGIAQDFLGSTFISWGGRTSNSLVERGN